MRLAYRPEATDARRIPGMSTRHIPGCPVFATSTRRPTCSLGGAAGAAHDAARHAGTRGASARHSARGKAIGSAVSDLDADVVGAGVEVRLHTGRDGGLVAPRDEGINEAVAAAVGEIVLAEAEPQPVVHVVRQLRGSARDARGRCARARAASVSSTTRCSGASSASRAERLAGLTRCAPA